MSASPQRHDLDAGGQLVATAERATLRVLVVIDDEVSHHASIQHTAWMTLNELVRLSGVVEAVGLRCPDGVALAGRVVPLAARNLDLASALRAGCAEIDIVAVEDADEDGRWDRVLEIGPGPSQGGLRVHGEGWWGGYSAKGVAARCPESANPLGPYTAASLAVGSLFCAAALREYEPTAELFYSCWTLRPSTQVPEDGPSLTALELDALLVGVGAVGSMVVHTLWALDQVSGRVALCDADKDGIDDTNLNRYVLFGSSSIGRPKAAAAAEVAADANLSWEPVDKPVQTIPEFPKRVVSAVDVNTAREAIQVRYPARILSASTKDLRAEALRIGAPQSGACLRCFNPPEARPADDALREALAQGAYGDIRELAATHGLTEAEVEAWVVRGECGRASERLLPALRADLKLPPEFAISFVSSLAGVILTAELLKDHFAVAVPLDDRDVRAVFQFAIPLARTNKPASYQPDPTCPLCGPAANAFAIEKWRERAKGLEPERIGHDN
jgi:hypothetical protein